MADTLFLCYNVFVKNIREMVNLKRTTNCFVKNIVREGEY